MSALSREAVRATILGAMEFGEHGLTVDVDRAADEIISFVRATEANGALIAAAPELLSVALDAEWALESIVEEEELGDECPRFDGFDLCGARCCEQSGCIVEKLTRTRAAIAKALGRTPNEIGEEG